MLNSPVEGTVPIGACRKPAIDDDDEPQRLIRSHTRQFHHRFRLAITGAVLLAACLHAPGATAGCMADALRRDGEFTQGPASEPKRVTDRLRALVATERSRPGSTAFRLPHLYAMLADAQFSVGALDLAAESTRLGLAAGGADVAMRHRLELQVAQVLEARDELPASLAQLERMAGGIPADAPYRRCFLAERGYLRFLNGEMGGAVADLTAAHEAERLAGNRDRTMFIAGILSSVYANVGFFDEARELTEDMIAYYTRASDVHGQADAYYRRGTVRFRSGDLAGAEADLRKSLTYARTETDPFDTGYAGLELCKVLVEAKRPAEAAKQCREIEALGRRVQSDYFVKVAQGYRAAAEAAQGRTKLAASMLDALLDGPHPAFSAGVASEFHLIRAHVRQALGDAAGAYEDAHIHIDESQRQRDLRSRQRVEVLRVRFEADRKTHALLLEQARAAQLEAEARQARIARNLAFAGGFVLLLTAAVVWAVRRRAVMQAQVRVSQERLQLLSRLTAGVAHEFNNLLTVVQQSTSLLARRPAVAADADTNAPLDAAREAVRSAGALTHQLLALGGHDRLQPARVELPMFFQRVEPELRRAAGERNAFELAVEPALPPIAVDAGQLLHALVAVVSNAREAIGERGGRVTVRARAEAARAPTGRLAQDGVVIEIEDDGPGMTEHVRARAHEPFFTTKQLGDGVGLGLSVVDAFVRQSGGTLRLGATRGGGANVQLWLPLERTGATP